MKIRPNLNLHLQPKPFKIPKESNPYYVITGGPGVGKTSILNELNQKGFTVVPEIVRELIKEQQATDGEALPWKNKRLYRDIMFDRCVESFESAMNDHKKEGPVFFDRGFLDALCYANLKGIPIKNNMKIMAETWRYNTSVFILPPWKEIYHTDEQRNQDWNEAVFTYNKMIQTYRTYQYDLVEVPKVSIKERADFILDYLRNH